MSCLQINFKKVLTILPIISNVCPLFPPLDEMKRRRDFYAAHPSADGKLFVKGKTFYLEGELTICN